MRGSGQIRISYGLDQAICSMELAEALDREAERQGKTVQVHVKVDTGMGRVGIEPDEAVPMLRRLKDFGHLKVVGIFSHLSSADEHDKSFTMRQFEAFRSALDKMRDTGLDVPLKHIANSAGVLDYPETYFDMVRPGIMIYGLYPSSEVSRSILLKTAMTFKTRVSMVKVVPPGTPISYGRTFVAPHRMTVATLPVGYADGLNRLLSNRGEVLIQEKRMPIIGRVCMDMTMVDVTTLDNIQVGDEAVLFGQGLHVDEVAKTLGYH